MKGWGYFLIIVGLICAFSAITMDTSVETNLGSRVNNLGLMNLQSNLVVGGGIAFIAGIMLFGFSSKPSSSSINEANNYDNKKCPYCAEMIKSEAIICRFCGKDLPVFDDVQANYEIESINKEKEENELLSRESKIIIRLQKELNKGNVINWYFEVLKKYAEFNGRARRKEYWYFVLFNIIASIILAAVDTGTGSFSEEVGLGFFSGIYTLAVLIPGIAVSIRRLHDTNRSGWWLLIALIPIVGPTVLLVFMVQAGTSGENQHGSDPKLN